MENNLIKENFKKPTDQKNKNMLSVLFNVLFITTIIICALSILLNLVFLPRMVKGASMQPTLNQAGYDKSDIVYVNPFAPIKRGIIVVLHREAQFAEDVVKRVIAVGGDEIKIAKDDDDYFVFLNGEKLIENYILPNSMSTTYDKWQTYIKTADASKLTENGYLKLDENQLFVLGDNRASSSDSSNYGPVEKSQVVGKVFMVVPYQKTIFHAKFL